MRVIFSDELCTARRRAQRLRDRIQSILTDNRRGEIIRAGIRLAIFGPPNVGKSSLLNFLGTMARSHRVYMLTKMWAAQREAAIVTHVPGTTRDILELFLDIGGLPVLVTDSAGLRDTADEVEKIGIERARKACVFFRLAISFQPVPLTLAPYRVQAADVSLLVLACPDVVTSTSTQSGPRLEIPVELAPLVTRNTFILLNKTDLLPTPALAPAALTSALPQHGWSVSLASLAGTDEFLAGLTTALQER